MDGFGFTKKKLTSLSFETRHKHIIKWLSASYQKLTTNRLSPASLDLFADQYNTILSWSGMDPFIKPKKNNTRPWIEAISDSIHHHRSIIGSTVRDYDLPAAVQTIDKGIAGNPIDLDCHVALDGLRSLFNVGSIFRTCEAAGFNSIILGNIPGKEHPGVRKTAMGAEEWIEQESTKDLGKTLLEKKKHGYKIIGIETVKGARPFYDIPWSKQTVIVFGNEEYGISSHVMSTCDEFVYIPMLGKKNSINVAGAVSVIGFQIVSCLSI